MYDSKWDCFGLAYDVHVNVKYSRMNASARIFHPFVEIHHNEISKSNETKKKLFFVSKWSKIYGEKKRINEWNEWKKNVFALQEWDWDDDEEEEDGKDEVFYSISQ